MMNERVDISEEGLLGAVLDSAIDYAIIALDPQNKISLWNTGAEKLLGWSADEVVGRSGSIILALRFNRAAARARLISP